MKKLLIMALALSLALSVMPAGVAPAVAEGEVPTLNIWSFTSELPTMVNEYYLKDNPGKINMEFTMVDGTEFEAKLDPALASGDGPDLWGINVAIVKKYVEAGVLADVSEYRERANALGIAEYVQSLGTDQNGALRTLSWQATPGGVWYRRSLAEKYLGVSEPEDVQPLLSDTDKVYETAQKLKEASDGRCYYTADAEGLWFAFNGMRTSPYVVDDQIVIDPVIPNYMDYLKKFTEEKLMMGLTGYTEDWYGAMSDSLMGADGQPVEIFSYSNASWFLGFCIQPNMVSADGSKSTEGDWALVEGPGFFFNGGTFIGVNANSKNLEASKELFEYLMLNEDFLARYCQNTGDYPAAQTVAQKLTDGMSSPILKGQNHYETFNAITSNIKELYTDRYFDETIFGFMRDQAMEYAAGNKDQETALRDYQEALMGQYPGLTAAN